MDNLHDRVALALTRKCHHCASIFVLFLGLSALSGWGLGVKQLHSPMPGLGTIRIHTALAFILAGLSLRLWQHPESRLLRSVARLTGLGVLLLGVLSAGIHAVVEYSASQVNWTVGNTVSLDILWPDQQMALNSSISFCFAGAALSLLDVRSTEGKRPAEWLAVLTALAPLATLVGYIYGEQRLITPFSGPFSPSFMALTTAVGLLFLSFAILSARPEQGWMARFVSDRPEGIVARKLLPAGILALLILGGLSELGERWGLYRNKEGAAVFIALSSVAFGLLVRHSMNALASLEFQRQKAEIGLRRSEEHLRMALEAAHVGTWEWNIQTDEVRWSDAIIKIFGLEQGAFNGKGENFLKIIHPDDRILVQERAMRAVQGFESYDLEYRVVRPDKIVRWIASRGEVFRDTNGTPLRIAGTSIDITERKILERELIEASNREQRRLGQDLHDDLGQWLTAIHLEARALSMKLKAKSESDAAHAERLTACIREALERTRLLARGMAPAVIESGGLPAALHELASCTERMFRTRCQYTCSDDLTVHNAEAALQLYRITQEAISNAIRHGKATEINVNLRPNENGRSCLVIHDNGHGISHPVPQTNGLGLHIMKYRAGLLGATMDIRPSPNGGTDVVCTFPDKL